MGRKSALTCRDFLERKLGTAGIEHAQDGFADLGANAVATDERDDRNGLNGHGTNLLSWDGMGVAAVGFG